MTIASRHLNGTSIYKGGQRCTLASWAMASTRRTASTLCWTAFLSWRWMSSVKVTNALSIDFYVASYRDGKCSWAKYSKGNLLEKGIEKTAEDNGTYIKFVPDPEVFTGYAFQEAIVKDILQGTARQNKGLSISLNGAIVPDSF